MTKNWSHVLGGSIMVDVAYYDSEHEEALNQYPKAIQIRTLVDNSVEIPVEEFLTYFLFHKTRCVPTRYPMGYMDLRRNIASAVAMLEDYVEWDGGKLRVSDGAVMAPTHVTEYIGESIGLAVVNRIHGLSEADWLPIEATPERPTFDYHYASDGIRPIELEAKGSVVENVELKSPSISNHKRSIQDKKKAQRPINGALLYGSIAAIPTGHQRAKCWLLDPEPANVERPPRDLRMITRMEFLRWIIWIVAPRSALATALATRLGALKVVSDPFSLSGVPLVQADGTEFPPQGAAFTATGTVPFFGSRSRVADGPVGGVIVPTGRGSMLFIGMQAGLLDLAAGQNFEEVLSYQAEVGSVYKEVRCVVPNGEFQRYDLDETALYVRRSGGYVHFSLRGTLRYSQEGLVFGVLPLEHGSARHMGW